MWSEEGESTEWSSPVSSVRLWGAIFTDRGLTTASQGEHGMREVEAVLGARWRADGERWWPERPTPARRACRRWRKRARAGSAAAGSGEEMRGSRGGGRARRE
jgi:hypothetical protein